MTKLVLSGTTVTGVEFAGSATETATKVSAKKEVVLAAGTAHTPQLLQLAGIGPKKLLESLGIKVVVDLPGVGSNFQDHPVLYFSGSCKYPSPYHSLGEIGSNLNPSLKRLPDQSCTPYLKRYLCRRATSFIPYKA